MSPAEDESALIITFPRAWTAAQRLEFMADVARGLPCGRWAHVGELMCTDSIAATAPETPGGLRAVEGSPRPRGGRAGRGHPRVDGMRPANTEAETPYAFRIMMPGTRFPAWAYRPQPRLSRRHSNPAGESTPIGACLWRLDRRERHRSSRHHAQGRPSPVARDRGCDCSLGLGRNPASLRRAGID
jgi:hypothetical protein